MVLTGQGSTDDSVPGLCYQVQSWSPDWNRKIENQGQSGSWIHSTDQINIKLMESTTAMISKVTKSKDQLFLMVPNLDDTMSAWL